MDVREVNKIIREEFQKLENCCPRYYNDKTGVTRRKVFKVHGASAKNMDALLVRLRIGFGITGWEKCYSAFNKDFCIGIKKYESD